MLMVKRNSYAWHIAAMPEATSGTVVEPVLRPVITGLSPKEGVPGTQIKIRGENLGTGQSDLLALSICGTDCLMSAKWKSPSLIVARVGQAKRGVGEIIILTKSMGRSVSNVTFRVFVVQIGPLEESAVWVDESRTVPAREAIRNIPETTESVDALGLKVEPQKKMDQASLMQMFPEGSGNRRMENFNPAWYLLENHRETSLEDLRKGLANLTRNAREEEKSSADVHRANLYSLISCVDALAALHDRLQLEKNTRGWPLTKNIYEELVESHSTADSLFHEVLNRKDRADATRNALSVLTRFRFIFFLSSAVDQNLAKGEYSTILNDYTRAKSLFKDTEVPLFKEVMHELDSKMEVFKKNMKQRLIDMPTSFEDQSKLIKYLKVLEPESDPAWDCITAYHCWLEDLLWQVQFKHHKIAVAEASGEQKKPTDMFSLVDGSSHSRQDFVQAIVNLVTDKLQTFWKLSQVYSASATNMNYVDRQHDICQMLINTINVSSWLMLNALVPSSVPESVVSQYKEQFVEWPEISSTTLTNQLFASLKIIRNCVSTMLDFNFTNEHLQPLIELCMTIRLKCLSKIVEKTTRGVVALGSKENWKVESVQNDRAKTILPDLFENEVNDSLPSIRQVLSFSGFSGELDLFTREPFRLMLIDLFTIVITSIRDCIENLLQLRTDVRRPSALVGENIVGSKKLLLAICNVEYVLSCSVPALCRRLSENGVKYSDVVFERSRDQLTAFRENLVKNYLQLKCGTFSSIIESAAYDDLPNDDVSDYIKELMMCMVFVQSEICLMAPQVLSPATQIAFGELMEYLGKLDDLSSGQATQLVADVSALEESLQNFLSLESRTVLNSFRAAHMKNLDQTRFQRILRNFRAAMRMAIASLNSEYASAPNDASDV
uniref:Exocyst complex component 2 n=1 Tax=Ascaris lumbricoides TaxID=6252 RepID=A0A0M3HWQ2_ASCLU